MSNTAEINALYQAVCDRLSSINPAPLNLTGQPLPDDARSDVIIRTSGSSTGRPSLVGLSWKALRTSAELTLDYLGGAGKWWLRLPVDRIAGLQVVVRSAVAGIPPSLDPAGCQYTAVVPTQLARAKQGQPEKDDFALAKMRAILVGGGPSPNLPPELRCVRTYGMTETAGGCVYDGVPLPGVSVKTVGERIMIAGPTLMDGYLDEPDPFVWSGDQKWLTTGDIGQFRDGKLDVFGRADDVIITGGVNVIPEVVRSQILQRLPHLEVEVLGTPDPVWGQAVTAAVVGDVEPAEVRGTTGGPEAPRVVVRLDSIPRLHGGKVDKAALRQQVEHRIGVGAAWRR